MFNLPLPDTVAESQPRAFAQRHGVPPNVSTMVVCLQTWARWSWGTGLQLRLEHAAHRSIRRVLSRFGNIFRFVQSPDPRDPTYTLPHFPATSYNGTSGQSLSRKLSYSQPRVASTFNPRPVVLQVLVVTHQHLLPPPPPNSNNMIHCAPPSATRRTRAIQSKLWCSSSADSPIRKTCSG